MAPFALPKLSFNMPKVSFVVPKAASLSSITSTVASASPVVKIGAGALLVGGAAIATRKASCVATYKVVAGDSLWAIAKKRGGSATIASIAKLNGITDRTVLVPGTTLKMPK